jgi:type IV pilus assembly protein PilB
MSTQPIVHGELDKVARLSGTLTSYALEAGLAEAVARAISLCDLLVVERKMSDEAVAEAFSRWLHVPCVRLATVAIEAAAISSVPGWLARKHSCLPIRIEGRKLVLALANPVDRQTIRDVQFAASRPIQPVVAPRTEILNGIERHYVSDAAQSEPTAHRDDHLRRVMGDRDVLDLNTIDDRDLREGSAIVQLVNQILLDAIGTRSSDIHIEPGADDLRVRLRVDGILRDHLQLPRWTMTGIASRIKIIAKLDIAERGVPQDGRVKMKSNGQVVDVRISTLPTEFGEKVVLRFLGFSTALS